MFVLLYTAIVILKYNEKKDKHFLKIFHIGISIGLFVLAFWYIADELLLLWLTSVLAQMLITYTVFKNNVDIDLSSMVSIRVFSKNAYYIFRYLLKTTSRFQVIPALEYVTPELATASGHAPRLCRLPHLRRGEGEAPEIYT